MKALVILQNAWSPVYAGGIWPRELWLRALRRSRSGQRLAVFEKSCRGVELSRTSWLTWVNHQRLSTAWIESTTTDTTNHLTVDGRPQPSKPPTGEQTGDTFDDPPQSVNA